MKRYWTYLKYVIRHKWLVAIAGYKVGVPIYMLIVHDLSKFLPSEFFSYAKTFYYPNGGSTFNPDDKFDAAWLLHQKRNKHHWQAWVMLGDDGTIVALPMPHKYELEMVADFLAMEHAFPNALSAGQYYKLKRDNMILHHDTQRSVERLLVLYSDFRPQDIRLHAYDDGRN